MLIKLAWRNLWRNNLRTRIVLAAMVFGLAGVTLMIGFMNGMVKNMTDNVIDWQTSHLQVHRKGYKDDPDIKKTLVDEVSVEAFLDGSRDVKHWASRHLANGMIASARSTRGITINGIDSKKEQLITPLASHIVEGEWVDEKGRNPVLISTKIATRLKLRVGSKIVLTLTNNAGEVSGAAFRVRGIFKSTASSFDEKNVFVRKTDLQTLSGVAHNHEIAILLKDINRLDIVRDQIRATFRQNEELAINQVQSWDEIQPMLSTMSATMEVTNLVMLLIFVVAMGFGIVNIQLMSVFERTCELGVLMAVGMQKSKILGLISFESSLLGLVGATLGIGISIIMINILQITGISLQIFADGLSAFGLDTLFFPSVAIGDYLLIFFTVVLAGFLAGLYPASQILKKNPAEAMSEKH